MRRIAAASLLALLLAAVPANAAAAHGLRMVAGPGAPTLSAAKPPLGATARTDASAGAAMARLLGASTTTPQLDRSGAGSPSLVAARVPFAQFSDGSTPAERGADFWRAYGRAFGIGDPTHALALVSVEAGAGGQADLRYAQRYRGVRVFGHELVLHMLDGAVVGESGDFRSGLSLSTHPRLRSRAARAATARALPQTASVRSPRLTVFAPPGAPAHLAWDVLVRRAQPFGMWRVFVDARSGAVLSRASAVETALHRVTYSSRHHFAIEVLERCADPVACTTTDQAAFAAHSFAGTVYDYYSGTFGRDSYDGLGSPIVSNVHFGRNFLNAAWIPGIDEMIYGDGDGGCVAPFSESLDVVAHELTHAVSGSTAKFSYLGQPGALNESYSDVFASFINPNHDWKVGDDLVDPVACPALARALVRDLTAPVTMAQYNNKPADNGEVHANSVIPSHAAYLLAQDIGIEKTQQIYYWALTNCLGTFSSFLENRTCLVQAANELQGLQPGLFADPVDEVAAVERSQDAVGVTAAPEAGTKLVSLAPRANGVIHAGKAAYISGRLLAVAANGETIGVVENQRIYVEADFGLWSTVTDANGRWKVPVGRRILLNSRWDVVFPGAGAFASTQSTLRRVLVEPSITARVHGDGTSHELVRPGRAFTMTGRVRPAFRGMPVAIEYRFSKHASWRTLGRVAVGRKGLSVRLRDDRRGTVYLRWRYDGSRRLFDLLDGVSPAVSVQVG